MTDSQSSVIQTATESHSPVSRVLRVGVWPRNFLTCSNPYGRLLANALAPHGIELVGDIQPTRAWLRESHAEFDALHFHWGVEGLWRTDRGSALSRLKRLAGFWKLLRLTKSLQIKLLWTVHNIYHHEGTDGFDWVGYNLLARYADLMICHSEQIRRQFLATRYADQCKVVVMPIGNYDNVFVSSPGVGTVRDVFNIDANSRLLISFGLIRDYKGNDVAIQAMARLPVGYHLVIAGPGDPRIVGQLRGMGEYNRRVTIIHDELTDQALADLVAASDCVLLPYRRITGSSAVLTAATLSKGYVASDLPYFRELHQLEPDSGVLAPPGDPEGLAHAIESYFTVPTATRNAASRRIADRYPWPEVIIPFVQWLRENVVSNRLS